MSRDLFKSFATDKTVERDGILLNYGNVRFRIARAGGANRQFNKVFQHDTKPYERQMKNNTLSDKDSDELMAGIYAKSIVLGWESNYGSDDQPEWKPTLTVPASKKHNREEEVLEFSPENVKKVLLLLPDLFADIREQATTASNFRDDDADEKN